MSRSPEYEYVGFGSTPVIEDPEPDFRKGSEAVIRSSRLNDATGECSRAGLDPLESAAFSRRTWEAGSRRIARDI
jgi:hypothetical protein